MKSARFPPMPWRHWRSICTIPLAAFALSGACTQGAVITDGGIDLCDYRLAHSDEFNDLSVSAHKLDGVRWTAHTPWNGDFGDAEFTNPREDGPFAVRDGKLRITASRDDKGKWHSGLVAAADAAGNGWGVQYGYFEARMRLPPGPGTWPAFWLMTLKPTSDHSPDIEIDVAEYYGHDTASYHVAAHVWYKAKGDNRSRHDGTKVAIKPGSLVGQFHDYGVRVTPEQITYYLDRRPVWQHPTPPEMKKPLYPLVDLALGSGYPIKDTPSPSVLEVDHVRVYAFDPQGRHSRCR